MTRDVTTESRLTLSGGRKGLIIGALTGAVVFALFSIIMDQTGIGTGGPGVNAFAGAAFGGLIGLMVGALRARHRPAYQGPDRRSHTGPYSGRERRLR